VARRDLRLLRVGMPLPPPGEVQVWTVELDRSAQEVGALGGILTADELLRAGAVKSERGRKRAVVARAAVRVLLARYLDAAPEALAFAAGPHGKPRLDGPDAPLRFNLSHSDGLALIAVARDVELGADVERVRPRHDLPGLGRRVFSEAERDAVGESEHAFYRHWTAKEAYVKAIGHGVASLRSFEVLLDAPGGGARIVHAGGDREAGRRFTLAPLDEPAPGYVGAVVAEHPDATVKPPAPFDPNPDSNPDRRE
jgi:4'-phosphopantetheinyl transferase